MGQATVASFLEGGRYDSLRTDPIRILEGTIPGIRFLGAGMIIFRRDANRLGGLTTAATILLTAGVGIGMGLNLYVVVGGLTLLAVVAFQGIHVFEGTTHYVKTVRV